MSISSINWLNIFFMVIAAIFAVNLPFETFLFSYAVIGPLHYLTEINWLNSKKYFISETNTLVVKILVGLIFFALFINSINAFQFYTHFLDDFRDAPVFIGFSQIANQINNFYLFAALLFSIVLVLASDIKIRLAIFFAGLVGGYFYYLLYQELFIASFTIFLPTIVHVWIFTGVFILSGCIKSNSFSGWLSLVIYIIISYLLLGSNQSLFTYHPSTYVKKSFVDSNFNMVNAYFHHYFYPKNGANAFSLDSVVGLRIQALVAFAYTYHYLNWFSKTSIIKWHQVDKKSMIVIATIWLISLLTYYIDYKLGLAMLYFISVLHVIVEFPLNVRSIKEIAISISSKSKSILAK